MAVAILGSASSSYSANILIFSPASGSVNLGQTVTLEARIDSVANLTDYQFDLLFDKTRFSPGIIADGTIFTGDIASDFFTPGTVSGGRISGNANSLFEASYITTTDGLLATFTFTALSVGVGNFSFDLINLFDHENQIANGASGTAAITVTSDGVPEPATWTLICAGILAAGLRRCRQP